MVQAAVQDAASLEAAAALAQLQPSTTAFAGRGGQREMAYIGSDGLITLLQTPKSQNPAGLSYHSSMGLT